MFVFMSVVVTVWVSGNVSCVAVGDVTFVLNLYLNKYYYYYEAWRGARVWEV